MDPTCEMRFTPEEAEVLRAVYLELINGDAANGNTAVSEFDWGMCKYGEDCDDQNPPDWKIFAGPQRLVEKLDKFSETTDEAITEIALDASLPAYDNWYTHKRHILGKRACQLANDIKEAIVDQPSSEGAKCPDHLPDDWTS